MDLKEIAKNMEFPLDDYYFEKSSADGYAFLGIAKKMLGLPYGKCLKEVNKRGPRLGAEWDIHGTKLTRKTRYTYTAWPVYEFYSTIHDSERCKEVIDALNDIGRYDNGMMRYCEVETNYLVPNVTAVAALTYIRHGMLDKASSLIDALEKHQKPNGNWAYIDVETGEEKAIEDSYHMAMILIALREMGNHFTEEDGMMIKAMDFLLRDNEKDIKMGSQDWGPSFIYLATLGVNEDLNKRAYEICKETIHHKNFRTRSMSIWALTKGEECMGEIE